MRLTRHDFYLICVNYYCVVNVYYITHNTNLPMLWLNKIPKIIYNCQKTIFYSGLCTEYKCVCVCVCVCVIIYSSVYRCIRSTAGTSWFPCKTKSDMHELDDVHAVVGRNLKKRLCTKSKKFNTKYYIKTFFKTAWKLFRYMD